MTLQNKCKLPENNAETGPLCFEISKEELEMCTYILRNGKSPGYDSISYAMCLMEVNPEFIRMFFNKLLNFPAKIRKLQISVISPIHKKRTKTILANTEIFPLFHAL